MQTVIRRMLNRVRAHAHAALGIRANGSAGQRRRLQEVARHVAAVRAQLAGDTTLFGLCPVCGESTLFVGDLAIARESLQCSVCLTTSRYRRLALGLLEVIERRTGHQVPTLKALAGRRLGQRLRVYDTQVPFYFGGGAYPLPDLLAACPDIDIKVSRFRAKDPLGSAIDVRPFASNQNLEALTFGSASFDVVLTSDVMEHVRRDELAHAEIRRVLAPGGTYLFTVPHTRGQRDTIHRVKVHDPADPARDEFVLPKEYHGDANDPDNAALSYRVYGTELDEALQRLGFQVDYRRDDRPAHGVLSTELFACTVATA
jgi:O-antigen biosynthesis protein